MPVDCDLSIGGEGIPARAFARVDCRDFPEGSEVYRDGRSRLGPAHREFFDLVHARVNDEQFKAEARAKASEGLCPVPEHDHRLIRHDGYGACPDYPGTRIICRAGSVAFEADWI